MASFGLCVLAVFTLNDNASRRLRIDGSLRFREDRLDKVHFAGSGIFFSSCFILWLTTLTVLFLSAFTNVFKGECFALGLFVLKLTLPPGTSMCCMLTPIDPDFDITDKQRDVVMGGRGQSSCIMAVIVMLGTFIVDIQTACHSIPGACETTGAQIHPGGATVLMSSSPHFSLSTPGRAVPAGAVIGFFLLVGAGLFFSSSSHRNRIGHDDAPRLHLLAEDV